MALRAGRPPTHSGSRHAGLVPYLRPEMRDHLPQPFRGRRISSARTRTARGAGRGSTGSCSPTTTRRYRPVLQVLRLQGEGYHCDEATDGEQRRSPQPGLTHWFSWTSTCRGLKGDEVCRRLRQCAALPPPQDHYVLGTRLARRDVADHARRSGRLPLQALQRRTAVPAPRPPSGSRTPRTTRTC